MTPRITKNNSIFMGADTTTDEKIFLGLRWLDERNMHILGPPGEGKSRLLLWLFQSLCSMRNATVILVNPKGSLARMACDWAMMNGHTKRLIWWDPRDRLVGYNPLLPNGASVTAQTKTVREGIRAAWGQASFDATAQLARFLFVGLGVARALELTILDAVQVLRSGARGKALRRKVLPVLAQNPDHSFLYEFLEWFDSRPERWQDEITASSLARLEVFTADPLIAAMLTEPRCMDFANVIRDHKILLCNFEINRPLTEDDVRLFGRLVINDIVSHAFSRPDKSRSPIYLIIDEAHEYLTHDLCRALAMGRELGLHVILSHQDLDQLRQEDETGKIYGAVMKCARVKCVFGDCHTEDLDIMIRDMMIDGYDNMKVKDQRDALELDPIETTRTVSSFAWTGGFTSGRASSKTRGKSHTVSRATGSTIGHAFAMASGHSSGSFTGTGLGESMMPSGDIIMATHESSGTSSGDFASTSESETETESTSDGESHGISETEGEGENTATTHSVTIGATRVPFYEYEKRRVVTSRTFESEAEYLTQCLQKAKAQPRGCFLLKLPKRPALFLRAPHVPDVKATIRRRKNKLERVFSQPFYLPPTPAREPSHPPKPMVESTDTEPWS
jgi:hypothetical protein